jgi:hypothetical protein
MAACDLCRAQTGLAPRDAADDATVEEEPCDDGGLIIDYESVEAKVAAETPHGLGYDREQRIEELAAEVLYLTEQRNRLQRKIGGQADALTKQHHAAVRKNARVVELEAEVARLELELSRGSRAGMAAPCNTVEGLA